MDGRHRRRANEMLYEEGRFSWTEGRFRVWHVVSRDGESIQHPEAIKLRTVVNTSTVLVWRNECFIDTMKAQVSNYGALKMEYGAKCVDARSKGLVYDLPSFDSLPTRSCRTCSRYVRFAKLVIKRKEILDVLEAPSSERINGKSLVISHVDSSLLYVSAPEDACFGRRHQFLPTNLTKTATSHGPSFYCTVRPVLLELHEFYHS